MNILVLLSHAIKTLCTEGIGISRNDMLILYDSERNKNDGSANPAGPIGLKCFCTLKRKNPDDEVEDGYTRVLIEHSEITEKDGTNVNIDSVDIVVYHYKMEWFVKPKELLSNLRDDNENGKNTKASIHSIIKGDFQVNQAEARTALLEEHPPNNALMIKMGYIVDSNSTTFDNVAILKKYKRWYQKRY